LQSTFILATKSENNKEKGKRKIETKNNKNMGQIKTKT
jgi:hypothetical protein